MAIATQACEDLLLGDGLADSLSRAERLVLASEQCRVSGVQALADEYRQRAESLGDALTPALRTVLAQPGAQTGNARLDAALHFVRTLALHPAESDRAALLAMPESGLSIDDTVLVAQLVGFIAYQLRLFAGVQAMVALGGQASTPAAEAAAAPSCTPPTCRHRASRCAATATPARRWTGRPGCPCSTPPRPRPSSRPCWT